LTEKTDVEQIVGSMREKNPDPALRKKLDQAWKRFEKEAKRRNL
jgi:hypothetical protein